MLVAGTQIEFPALWEFCKRQRNSICWVEVVWFPPPPPSPKPKLLTPKLAFEVLYLFSPSCSSEESSIRTFPGQSRGDRVPLPEVLLSGLLVLPGVKRLCAAREQVEGYLWRAWIHV